MSRLYHDSFSAMGTRCHVVLLGMDDDEGEAVIAILRQEIHEVETLLSRFIRSSEVAQINERGRAEPVEVGAEVFGILQRCKDYHQRTGGAFDITLRPLWQFWNERVDGEGRQEGLEALRARVGMRFVELNPDARTVRLLNDTVDIDLGGFGKGYALERVDRLLEKFSIGDAFISFGESSILTRGRHPAGDHWKVGLNHYGKAGESVYSLALNNGSVSTSSNFFVDDDGQLRHHQHVMSPFTGRPLDRRMTASVAAASAEVAEVLSTAVLILHGEQRQKVAEAFPDCEIVTVDYDGAEPNVSVFKRRKKPHHPAFV